MRKLAHFFLVIYIFISFSILANNIPKTGGICFRIDDNGLISQYRDYTNIFQKHGQKYTFAMNLALPEFSSIGYADSIKKFQDLGHELMDHTPNHRTNYFTTIFDISNYSNAPGVSHIISNKVCLKHQTPDTLLSVNSDTLTINKDTLYFSSGVFSNIVQYKERYFYFPELDTTVLVVSYDNEKAFVTDIWDEPVNFAFTDSLKFFSFERENINLTPNALEMLVNETKLLANNYNLIPPQTWIQPGGNFPQLHSYEIKQPFENIGYTSGATYPNSSKKVYNEYNPIGDRQFAIQWGDFVEDEFSLDKLKKVIADGVAKHKVLIGNGHWYSDDINKWNDYIAKNDSLLEWATSNNIPIKTYSEWSDILYNQSPNPYENIIPPLNVDKDSNGIPDGYGNVLYPISDLTGTLIDDSTAIDGKAYRSIYLNNYKQITHILAMGGVEKGENDFSIYTKGKPGNTVRVKFSVPWPGSYSEEFIFPADSDNWRKYDLSQSINGNTDLFISDTVSLINIDIFHQSTDPQPIYISGMYMAKKISIDSIDINILDSLPHLVDEEIKVEISLFDEFGNPAITSYEYEVSFPDTSHAVILNSPGFYFNNTSKDTITIKCDEEELLEITVNLKNAPEIKDVEQINIVYPLQHLDIKVFVEGSYDSTNNKMKTSLNSSLPLVSPYTEAIDSVNNIPNSVVDWVLVTLVSKEDDESYKDIAHKSALLKHNGNIIDPHTHGNLGFRVKEGNYYIKIKHRNHLSIMSSTTIEFSD